MNKLLIIKVGSTLPSLAARRGDFEDWVVAGLGVSRDEVTVLDVRNGAPLPDYDAVSGVVITGSHEMVTAHKNWSERTATWLPGVIERQIPTLGICYGHQLLAHAFGGSVDDRPDGPEFGTVEVMLGEHAAGDRLLGHFESPIRVQVSHYQSVYRLPAEARHLAWSRMDENQAFVLGECAWGLQFHPEFDAEVLSAYVRHFRAILLEQGLDADALLQDCTDTRYGQEILRRFAGIVRDQDAMA